MPSRSSISAVSPPALSFSTSRLDSTATGKAKPPRQRWHLRLISPSTVRLRRPRLNLTVEGEINLRCQRCLGGLAFPVAVESSLLVLKDRAGGETAEIDDLDGIPADPHTEVRALIEDEVLLAIPIAPRHPEGQCSAAVKSTQDNAASPFAALAKLKRN